MNQKNTIWGACEYAIEYLRNIKKTMGALDNKNPERVWAIGSIITTLTAQLLSICDEVIKKSFTEGNQDATNDLLEIKKQMNEFIDRMINNAKL